MIRKLIVPIELSHASILSSFILIIQYLLIVIHYKAKENNPSPTRSVKTNTSIDGHNMLGNRMWFLENRKLPREHQEAFLDMIRFRNILR